MKLFSMDIAWKGFAMGIAEVIPGVSGGTIAFITGIYERLMNAITSFDLPFANKMKGGKFREAMSSLDLSFIFSLGLGMAGGIIIGVFTISYLLVFYPEPLWGFFFGLILSSAWFIARQWQLKNLKLVAAMLTGLLVAFGITILTPAEGNTSYPSIFFSAILAISAMLLPGISGSFMLVLMGMYNFILGSVKNFLTSGDLKSLSIMLVFSIGLVVGAATFARLFSWLFMKYKDITLAILTGFLLGSLNKIWPWRNIKKIFLKESGEVITLSNPSDVLTMNPDSFKIISEISVFPSSYSGEPKIIITIVSCILGFLIVFMMDFYKKGKV